MPETKPRTDDEILLIGRQMSNVMFNLAQRGDGVSNIHISAQEYKPFRELQEKWDTAVLKYRNSLKRKKRKK